MSKKSRIVAAVLLLALILGGTFFLGSCASQQKTQSVKQEKTETGPETREEAPEVTMAPDFTLEDLNGHKVRLSDLKGQKVLINFWTTWCTYCRAEMPLLQQFYEQTKNRNWQVLMVNITVSERGLSNVKNYLTTNKFTFPVLLDKKGEAAALYGINSIPTSFIINEKGEVIKTKMGPFTESEITELTGQK